MKLNQEDAEKYLAVDTLNGGEHSYYMGIDYANGKEISVRCEWVYNKKAGKWICQRADRVNQ